VMRAAGDGAHGRRLRGLMVILWRAGLRVQEALALTEADLDQRRGSLLIRRRKGGRRREVGMAAARRALQHSWSRLPRVSWQAEATAPVKPRGTATGVSPRRMEGTTPCP
jgi:site-specific recombinase XerD